MARYVRELDRALVADGVSLHRYAIGRGPHPSPSGTARFTVPLRILRHSWRVVPYPRAESIAKGGDLVHVTDIVPPPTRLPLVLTVHDLDAIEHPDLHGRYARALQLAQLRGAKHRADAVIADSTATAEALQRHGVARDRITVIQLGLTQLPAADHRLVPAGPYLLAVGTLDARKGFDVLISAFGRAELDGVQLVIVGPDGHRADDVRALATASGVEDRIALPGRVSDAELAGLYEGATVFCLPSRAEGFGLPALEAMAAGAPVLSSELPTVREVAGDAAIYVPIGDVDAWRDALERLVPDDAGRAALAESGRSTASRFTWEATARATRAIYERVTGQRGNR